MRSCELDGLLEGQVGPQNDEAYFRTPHLGFTSAKEFGKLPTKHFISESSASFIYFLNKIRTKADGQ